MEKVCRKNIIKEYLNVFFRTDSARSRAKGGAGVGLALVKQAMEKQGGDVRVVSAQNGGAEFICEFPV